MGPYELLGVAPGATELDVRRAHRELRRLLQSGEQPTRDRADRHLQLVDEARERVLADLRRRERPTRPGAAEHGLVPVVPAQRSASRDLAAERRWVEHQEWLGHQQRDEGPMPARAEARRQRRRTVFLAPFVAVTTLDLALGVAMLLDHGWPR